MGCNCNHSNIHSGPVNGELGFWPFDWIERKATEFCMEKAYEQLIPVVSLLIALFVFVILSGRIKWI
ncbi:hypothetical protein [Leptospira santarosai]|uniref:Uncharacterized protein n=1 Tax=Leptospira santarosai TaxID=28183 RepID=A0AB73MNU8_9LEPT|nr:hypothetical protein [Leptospira santarosai]AVV52228.1 Uncharacterized protein XB17_03667 [Leptospira santarosai]ONF90120.1 hypothetical protein BWD14_19960 [Leptospira santarosai]